MSWDWLTWLTSGAILYAAPLLYPALGEVIEQRAGIVNLGLEGLMLVGAALAFAVTAETGSPWFGVLAAALAGGVMNLGFGYLVISRRAPQLASGLALMFLGFGLSAMLGKGYINALIRGLPRYQLPGWGAILFNYDLLVYLLFPLALGLWWVLFRTRWGLRLRAVGEDPITAFAAGISPAWVRYQAVFLAGLLAGIGGAHLSVGVTLTWSEGMTAGRGFIAIALVIFSRWHPLRAIVGALLFGGAVVFQLQLQARGVGISPFFLDMLPYVLTILVLLIWGRAGRQAAPASLGRVYYGTE
jgi:simple sugar transport system permease protein